MKSSMMFAQVFPWSTPRRLCKYAPSKLLINDRKEQNIKMMIFPQFAEKEIIRGNYQLDFSYLGKYCD